MCACIALCVFSFISLSFTFVLTDSGNYFHSHTHTHIHTHTHTRVRARVHAHTHTHTHTLSLSLKVLMCSKEGGVEKGSRRRGNVWCNGQHICFPTKCLPPMLESRFESWLRLEYSGFGRWYFLKHVTGGFLVNSGFLLSFTTQWFHPTILS